MPFINIKLIHNSDGLTVENVLIDTGSAGCRFDVEELGKIGLAVKSDSKIHRRRGVGGYEWVYETVIDQIIVAENVQSNFPVDVGVMDYGFGINGILGFDLLQQARLTIDFNKMEIV